MKHSNELKDKDHVLHFFKIVLAVGGRLLFHTNFRKSGCQVLPVTAGILTGATPRADGGSARPGHPTHEQGSLFICSGLLSHLNKVFNFSIKVLHFLLKGNSQVLYHYWNMAYDSALCFSVSSRRSLLPRRMAVDGVC